jgi:hypothetical protein
LAVLKLFQIRAVLTPDQVAECGRTIECEIASNGDPTPERQQTVDCMDESVS